MVRAALVFYAPRKGLSDAFPAVFASGNRAVNVYRSKTDAWLVAILVFSAIASLFGAIVVWSAGSAVAWALASFIAGIGAGLPLWLLYSTSYTLGQGQLVVRSGPFTWRITIADITSVTPTSSPLSSPALSMDRLRIEYGKGASLMISPRDKNRFLNDLEAARRAAV